MRIITYNVQGFRGFPAPVAQPVIGDPEGLQTARIFEQIFRELEPDILALQEGVSIRQMQTIAANLGLHLATFPSPVRWPGHLLSKFPIHESRIFSHFTPDAETQPLNRVAGAACLQLKSEVWLWLVLIHLNPKHREVRRQEARILMEKISGLLAVDEHVIVLGDFNSSTEEELHIWLKQMGFINTVEFLVGAVPPTLEIADKPKAIDHIYVSASLAGFLSRAGVIRSEGFCCYTLAEPEAWVYSDHLPVFVELNFAE